MDVGDMTSQRVRPCSWPTVAMRRPYFNGLNTRFLCFTTYQSRFSDSWQEWWLASFTGISITYSLLTERTMINMSAWHWEYKCSLRDRLFLCVVVFFNHLYFYTVFLNQYFVMLYVWRLWKPVIQEKKFPWEQIEEKKHYLKNIYITYIYLFTNSIKL